MSKNVILSAVLDRLIVSDSFVRASGSLTINTIALSVSIAATILDSDLKPNYVQIIVEYVAHQCVSRQGTATPIYDKQAMLVGS